MNQKTPRQIDEEAQILRNEHKKVQDDLRRANDNVEDNISYIHFHDSMVRTHEALPDRKRVNNLYGHSNGAGLEGNRQALDERMHRIGHAVLEQGRLKEQAYINDKAARQHYEDNRDAYHALALAEATVGVHINVSQEDGVAEAVNVRVIPPEKG